ncbi:hypothetical protein GCM10008986_13080 [Salinibacillus aidingensis]|uniref:Uncharacterized protein n=1 Tax=Salinibacillus aidingensis TaxID=237684 RepID=A0ABN1B237_9BACI
MIDVLLYTLVAGLFMYEVYVIRMAMHRQNQKVLNTFTNGTSTQPEPENVKARPAPKPVFAVQESARRIKD